MRLLEAGSLGVDHVWLVPLASSRSWNSRSSSPPLSVLHARSIGRPASHSFQFLAVIVGYLSFVGYASSQLVKSSITVWRYSMPS